jgi:hypothetical protein
MKLVLRGEGLILLIKLNFRLYQSSTGTDKLQPALAFALVSETSVRALPVIASVLNLKLNVAKLTILSGSLVKTAWCFLRLQMEETTSRHEG